MFDPITSSLIAASPPLEGLEREALPKRLTEAFADIVAARIRGRTDGVAGSEHLQNTLLEMRRLAAAHEAFVVLLPERAERVAAAFVAASAHQVCLLGKLATESNDYSYLDGASIAPEVSATLLFIVAEAHADAAECAKRIVVGRDNSPTVRTLLSAIKLLASSRLRDVQRLPIPSPQKELDPADQAVEALYRELLIGIKKLAARLLSRVDAAPGEGGIEPPASFFNRVAELSVATLDVSLDTGDRVFDIFPGPLHLAHLLLAAERDLVHSASTRIPAPWGVEEDSWWQIISRMARKRPFLWRNHREAIAQGYLEKGISSAISFPTGGGKSTLAELKIAGSLIRNEKVVFLVPTHALVDQTTHALKDTFNTFDILGDVDDEGSISDILVLPEAIVTTPERCLTLLTAQPEAFADLGLIVFDECHLLHPRDTERSRRSVDAMLAVLNLTIVAPKADLLLLSAMMKNTEEIAHWLRSFTGRHCLALDLAWKPTRQVRGSVVYPATRIKELNKILSRARKDHPSHKNTPMSVSRELIAQPFGFFGLLQTWASKQRDDYTLLPLLDKSHHLLTGKAKSGGWYLTPNVNHTSALIAASAAASRLKTLVFVQSTVLAEASVGKFSKLLARPAVALEPEERTFHRLAAEEMGGPEYCYLNVAIDGTVPGGAASHHALLLREERLLHESLFKRKDGIDVLFATSTLAQGMNLPSEVVIISGDSRFDPKVDKMAQLEAHELLNAAGRAGRAGESSQGFVLVVPSRVVEFDDETNFINQHWMTLQSIFAQSDQCLDIDDPTAALLDKIHAGAAQQGLPAYFLSRLPASGDGTDGAIRKVLTRSFAAFRARQKGNEDWIESRIAAAFAARMLSEPQDEEKWLDRVAGLTGVSVNVLREFVVLFNVTDNYKTTEIAIEALIGWLKANPAQLLESVRPENVAGFFGGEYEALATDRARGEFAIPLIGAFIKLWMGGAPLKAMESAYPNGGEKIRCKHSRHFALRLVPEIAFMAGLPGRLWAAQNDPETPVPIILSTLSACVREGCISPEHLAVRLANRRTTSRVATRARYDELLPFFVPRQPDETFDQTRERYTVAAANFASKDL